jgi:septum formation topological specificity factor MinE
MNSLIKYPAVLFVLIVIASPPILLAAPRDAGGANKMVAKLQAMVKELTVERDQIKAEKDKLVTDLDQLKQEKAAAASAEGRLSEELSAQKNSNEAVQNKLEQTHGKLLEVIEKYKALVKEKNELTTTHVSLQDIHKQTETELQSCESKNIKMFEASKELLVRYEDKGIMDSLLKSEPVLQFKSVEMETVIQEYEDKLSKQKYQHKDIAVTKNTSQVAGQPEETEQQ